MHQVTYSLTAWTCAFSFSAATNYQLAAAWKEEKINKQSQNSSAKTISCSFETKENIICSLPRHAAWLCECDEKELLWHEHKPNRWQPKQKKITSCEENVKNHGHLKKKKKPKLIYGWGSEPYWSPRLKKLRDFRNINPLEKYHNSVLFQSLVLNLATALHWRLIGIHHGSDVSSPESFSIGKPQCWENFVKMNGHL